MKTVPDIEVPIKSPGATYVGGRIKSWTENVTNFVTSVTEKTHVKQRASRNMSVFMKQSILLDIRVAV